MLYWVRSSPLWRTPLSVRTVYSNDGRSTKPALHNSGNWYYSAHYHRGESVPSLPRDSTGPIAGYRPARRTITAAVVGSKKQPLPRDGPAVSLLPLLLLLPESPRYVRLPLRVLVPQSLHQAKFVVEVSELLRLELEMKYTRRGGGEVKRRRPDRSPCPLSPSTIIVILRGAIVNRTKYC